MRQNPYGKKPTQSEADTFTGGGQPGKKARKRRFTHILLKPLLWVVVNLLWASCRKKIIGQGNMDQVLSGGKPVIPCYWHQQQLFCGWYMLQQIKQGMKVGFLISPSVDGEIPAKIVAAKGAQVIRGSSTRTGAQALRDMYQLISRDGVSPVTTPDGPTGPIFGFKPGTAMLSRLTGAPMLPMACAAKSAWYFGSWDKFMLPKPFTRVVIVVGEPVMVDPQQSTKDLAPVQAQMETAINNMMSLAAKHV